MKTRIMLLNIAFLLSMAGICRAQESKKDKLEKDPNEQTSSSETLHKEDTNRGSSTWPESRKGSANWMGRLFSPIIKYSPADVEVPYTILPDTLQSWKNFKKHMEEKYGTSIGITLDDHHQQILTHHDYREAKNATHTETIFELYYKIYITEWCSLAPDIQILLNPGTNADNDTSVIPGIRVKMVF